MILGIAMKQCENVVQLFDEEKIKKTVQTRRAKARILVDLTEFQATAAALIKFVPEITNLIPVLEQSRQKLISALRPYIDEED